MNYDFPVKLMPVQSDKIIIPDKAAVIRTDTNEPIGLVSNRYGLLEHKEIINAFRSTFKNDKIEEKITVAKNGAHLFAEYTFPNITFDVKKGDPVALKFIAKNSYDGSKSFQLTMGAFRLVCENGMVIGKEFFSLTQRHIESGQSLKEVMPIKSILEDLKTSFSDKTLPILKEMTKQKVGEEIFNSKELLLPKYLLNTAKEEYDKQNKDTVWDYYNSLTFAISHKLRKDKIEVRMEYLKRAWVHSKNFIEIN